MKKPTCLFLLGLVAAVVAAAPAQARVSEGASAAAADWTGFRFLGTTCHLRGGLEFAHLRVGMRVVNGGYGPHWASNMRVKARLVSPNAGFSFEQSWRTQRYPVVSELLQDRSYVRVMAVNTDTVNPDADWKLEIKLIWDRAVPFADVVKHFKTTFNGCGGSGALTPPIGYGR